MDETTKKVLMIMLIILGVVFIAFGAIFNYAQKDAHDWESLGLGNKETVEEPQPEVYTPFSSGFVFEARATVYATFDFIILYTPYG